MEEGSEIREYEQQSLEIIIYVCRMAGTPQGNWMARFVHWILCAGENTHSKELTLCHSAQLLQLDELLFDFFFSPVKG